MSLQQGLAAPETAGGSANLKPGYPASELIKALIERYWRDFSRYRRNVHISQTMLEGWHSIYEAILSHMDSVAMASTEPQWDSFIKLTSAITLFEEYLLNLDVHLNVNGVPSLPVKDEISVTITFLTNWVNNRRKFIDAGEALNAYHYTNLFSNPRAFRSQAELAVRQDDLQVLQDLADRIASHELQDRDISGGQPTDDFVSDTKKNVENIRSRAISLRNDEHDRMGRIISALMAIYIPFIGHEPNTPTAHINSRNVWLAAQTFALETEQYSSSNSNLTVDQFEEKWITYRHVLMMQLGSEYIIQIDTLMRLAARVRWHYIGRTLSVVLSEFKKAAIDVDFFSDPSSLDAVLAARSAAYASVVGRIGIEFKKHPLGVQKWDNLFDGFRKGAEEDAENVRQLRQFAAANSQFLTLS
ncbi:hypothetical protein H1R20_g14015, partial [Candolleomyces eurysporus]